MKCSCKLVFMTQTEDKHTYTKSITVIPLICIVCVKNCSLQIENHFIEVCLSFGLIYIHSTYPNKHANDYFHLFFTLSILNHLNISKFAIIDGVKVLWLEKYDDGGRKKERREIVQHFECILCDCWHKSNEIDNLRWHLRYYSHIYRRRKKCSTV